MGNFTTKCTTSNHPHSGKKMKIRGTVTCNQKNVIYQTQCLCGFAYVRKTSRPLKTRIAEHRRKIQTKDQRSAVALHFAEAQHSVSCLRYVGTEHVKDPRGGGDFDNLLLRRESYYIHKLHTVSPKGLNQENEMRHFFEH